MECPVCQGTMEENAAYVTECCGVAVEDGEDECPGCGAAHPIIVASVPTFSCEQCGYEET